MRIDIDQQAAAGGADHVAEGGLGVPISAAADAAVERLSVRACVAADWPLLKTLRLAALRDAPTAFGVSHAQAAAEADSRWQARAAGSGPGRFYLAFGGNHAIGMAAAVRGQDDSLGLIAMWVAPPWRGLRLGESGAADLLVDAIQAQACADGATALLLEVAPANLRAVAFYRRHGFAFQPHYERLASHPEITIQRMAWLPPARSGLAPAL